MTSTARYMLLAIALVVVVIMGAAGLWIGTLLEGTQAQVAVPPAPAQLPKRIAELQADWSNQENPHTAAFGTWSYNQGLQPMPFVRKWAALPAGGIINGWGPAANQPGDMLPFIFQVPPNPDAPDLGTDLQPGDILLHSTDSGNGPRNGPANITWTSPINGIVTVSGALWPTKRFGRLNGWTLTRVTAGDTKALAFGELPEDGTISRGAPSAFKVVDVSVREGEAIKLQVVRSPRATDPYGDFAGMTLTITEQDAILSPRSSQPPAVLPAPATGNSFVNLALIAVIVLLSLIALALSVIVILLLRRQRPSLPPLPIRR